MLTTEMQLIPIAQFASKMGKKKNCYTQIELATTKLFQSELKYVKPPRIEGPGLAREDTI